MSPKLYVQPLSRCAQFADRAMVPLMQFLIGDACESPQQTHRWNNTKLKPDDVANFRKDYMVLAQADPEVSGRFWKKIPHFHLTRWGGWKKYIVLQPTKHIGEWHIGWIAYDLIGVSRIEATGPIRVLLGPGDCTFFGVSAYNHVQLPIQKIGDGCVGDGGPYRKVPLL